LVSPRPLSGIWTTTLWSVLTAIGTPSAMPPISRRSTSFRCRGADPLKILDYHGSVSASGGRQIQVTLWRWNQLWTAGSDCFSSEISTRHSPVCDLWQLHTAVPPGVVWPTSVPMTNEFADWLSEFAERPERSERPYRVYDLVEVTDHRNELHQRLIGTVFSFSSATDLGEFRSQRAKAVGG